MFQTANINLLLAFNAEAIIARLYASQSSFDANTLLFAALFGGNGHCLTLHGIHAR